MIKDIISYEGWLTKTQLKKKCLSIQCCRQKEARTKRRQSHFFFFTQHLRKKHNTPHLHGFSLASLHRVLHLVAGVEAGEGGEGVDPGAARARKRPHEAGDAAQGRDGLRRQGRVHQQVGHHVPGLVDDREVHAVAAHRTLSRAHKRRRHDASLWRPQRRRTDTVTGKGFGAARWKGYCQHRTSPSPPLSLIFIYYGKTLFHRHMLYYILYIIVPTHLFCLLEPPHPFSLLLFALTNHKLLLCNIGSTFIKKGLCFYLNSQSGLQHSSLRYTPKSKTTGCFFSKLQKLLWLYFHAVWLFMFSWFGQALCLVVHISVVVLSLGLSHAFVRWTDEEQERSSSGLDCPPVGLCCLGGWMTQLYQ